MSLVNTLDYDCMNMLLEHAGSHREKDNAIRAISVNAIPPQKLDRALCAACEDGDVSRIKELAERGAKVADKHMLIAAEHNRPEAIRFLVGRGLDPNGWHGAPVSTAIENGALGSLKELVRRGADLLHIHDLEERAVESGDAGIVRYLIEQCAFAGSDPTYLIMTAAQENFQEVAEVLVDYYGTYCITDEALTFALDNGHDVLANKLRLWAHFTDMGTESE